MIGARVYTVTEVAKRLGISPSTIKSWEWSGYIPKARRINLNRIRVYTESQIQEIEVYMRENY